MLQRILRRLVLSFAMAIALSALSHATLATIDLPSGQDGSTRSGKMPAEVAEVLAAIGSGSAAEIKSRLFTNLIYLFTDEYRVQAVKEIHTSIRYHRISGGNLFRRVKTIFSQVLQLHGRSGTVELFLFKDDLPNAILWRGCVLAISDGLADPLYDGELAGIIAHELGHSYFEDEMASALKTKDTRTMKVVELKCDAVAILSLKLLDRNPVLYLKALHQIREIMRRKGRSSGIFESHPELFERAQFSQHFIQTLRSAEAGKR